MGCTLEPRPDPCSRAWEGIGWWTGYGAVFSHPYELKNLCSKPSPLPAVGCVPGLQGDGGSTALRRLFTGPAAAQGPAKADLVSLLSPGVPDGSTFHSPGFLPLSFSPTKSKSCTA